MSRDTVAKAEANDRDLHAARRMAAEAQHAARRYRAAWHSARRRAQARELAAILAAVDVVHQGDELEAVLDIEEHRADTVRRIRELCTDRHSRVLGTEARGWRWYVDVDDVLRILHADGAS